MAYPYSPAETAADGVVHFIGLAICIPASVYLLWQVGQTGQGTGAIVTYVACLLVSLIISAVYHMSPFDRTRPILRRADHAAIYFKIAGTYSPFVFLIGSGFAYGLLGLVWVLAIFGAAAKLLFWDMDGKGSLALYLLMGWLSSLLIWPMLTHLEGITVALIATGGLIYTAGTLVYARKEMAYQNAVWHTFVLAASLCFLTAVTVSL